MVPRDVEIMIDARRAEQEQMMRFQDRLNGQLCAIMAEPYRDKDNHPDQFTASDFMIFKEKEPEPEPITEQEMTDEQIRKSISTMKNWVATTGGKSDGRFSVR